MPEYTKVITFECEGEEYLAEVYVGKNCSALPKSPKPSMMTGR